MQLKLNDTFKHKKSAWSVKVVYFTDLEVCTEDLTKDNVHGVKFLSVFSLRKFFHEFEPCN